MAFVVYFHLALSKYESFHFFPFLSFSARSLFPLSLSVCSLSLLIITNTSLPRLSNRYQWVYFPSVSWKSNHINAVYSKLHVFCFIKTSFIRVFVNLHIPPSITHNYSVCASSIFDRFLSIFEKLPRKKSIITDWLISPRNPKK